MKRLRIKKVLFIGIVLLFLLVIGYGYLFFHGMSGIHFGGTGNENQIRVACIGDSITYGHGVSCWPKKNYPKVLGSLLGEDYYVRNFGMNGRTAMETGDRPYTEEKLYQTSLHYSADVIVLMLGTNDSKLENWSGAEKFKMQYLELVESYLNVEASPQIYLCTLSKAYDNSFGIQDVQAEEISRIIMEVAEEMKLPVIDIRSLTSEHPEWFKKDGVHPNADGAAAIAELVAATIKRGTCD